MNDLTNSRTRPSGQKETDMTDIPNATFLQAMAAAAVLAGLLLVMNTLGKASGAALHLSGVVI